LKLFETERKVILKQTDNFQILVIKHIQAEKNKNKKNGDNNITMVSGIPTCLPEAVLWRLKISSEMGHLPYSDAS
jgi:hypothetical protein